MNGWLIVNEFVKTEKFNELFVMLQQSASRCGIELTRKTNAEVWTMLASCGYRLYDFFTVGCPFTASNGAEMIVSAGEVGIAIPDFIIFWDKDVRLAHELERQGMRLYNTAQAIEDCDDKAVTYLKLQAAGLRQPRSVIAPKKFHNDGTYDEKFLKHAITQVGGFPCVVKECFGSFGQQVYLARDMAELISFAAAIGERPFMIQQYVSSSQGRDIRIEVVGGRIVAAMERSNPADFRANISNGGMAMPCGLNEAQAQMALAACQVLGLEFGGVDLLYGLGGTPLVCEVNSNAHFKNLYDCTGINAADYIMGYIAATAPQRQQAAPQ